MSTSRLFSLFVALTLVTVAVLTIRAGIATSEIVSSPKVALDQHERHPNFINQSAPANLSAAAALAEQARLEFRRGEWYASYGLTAAELAEQARLEFRQGEWNAGRSASLAEFDVEQARLGWRARK